MLRLTLKSMALLAMLSAASLTWAQGQDSTPAERDAMVIRALLTGTFSNTNQAYFDVRAKQAVRHPGHELIVTARDDGDIVADARWSGDDSATPRQFVWRITPDADAVRMTVRVTSPDDDTDNGDTTCDLIFQREAEQFRGIAEANCATPAISEMLLGPKQLWLRYDRDDALRYQLHRARSFTCYADVPGVGGGRDEPYERYGEFELHDQGGSAWFTTTDGRELGISLLLVDWPINNYDGAFARDSLVVYVSEKLETGNVEHGYAFTRPDADRIGINLKWVLAMCYQQSNRDVTPFM